MHLYHLKRVNDPQGRGRERNSKVAVEVATEFIK